MTQQGDSPRDVPHDGGSRLGYDQLHRAGPRAVWRPLLGVTLVAVGTFLVSPLVWQLVFVLGYVAAGEPVVASAERLLDLTDPTPMSLAYLNLTLASAIPVVWFATRALHGIRPRWVTSVAPRMRWRWFARCLGLAAVALGATLVVAAVLPQPGVAGPVPEGPNAFTSTVRDFLLVVVLLTPLQAAGEEYLFRGYLTQAFGGLFGSRVLAVVLPAVLFALAHGAQDLPVFVDRLAFGLVAGVLVIATGGLEAAIAMHVLNNFVAFGLALAFTDMGSALNPTGGTWWSLPGTLTQSLVFLGVVLASARRSGLATTVEGAVLEGSTGHVYRSALRPGGR